MKTIALITSILGVLAVISIGFTALLHLQIVNLGANVEDVKKMDTTLASKKKELKKLQQDKKDLQSKLKQVKNSAKEAENSVEDSGQAGQAAPEARSGTATASDVSDPAQKANIQINGMIEADKEKVRLTEEKQEEIKRCKEEIESLKEQFKSTKEQGKGMKGMGNVPPDLLRELESLEKEIGRMKNTNSDSSSDGGDNLSDPTTSDDRVNKAFRKAKRDLAQWQKIVHGSVGFKDKKQAAEVPIDLADYMVMKNDELFSDNPNFVGHVPVQITNLLGFGADSSTEATNDQLFSDKHNVEKIQQLGKEGYLVQLSYAIKKGEFGKIMEDAHERHNRENEQGFTAEGRIFRYQRREIIFLLLCGGCATLLSMWMVLEYIRPLNILVNEFEAKPSDEDVKWKSGETWSFFQNKKNVMGTSCCQTPSCVGGRNITLACCIVFWITILICVGVIYRGHEYRYGVTKAYHSKEMSLHKMGIKRNTYGDPDQKGITSIDVNKKIGMTKEGYVDFRDGNGKGFDENKFQHIAEREKAKKMGHSNPDNGNPDADVYGLGDEGEW